MEITLNGLVESVMVSHVGYLNFEFKSGCEGKSYVVIEIPSVVVGGV